MNVRRAILCRPAVGAAPARSAWLDARAVCAAKAFELKAAAAEGRSKALVMTRSDCRMSYDFEAGSGNFHRKCPLGCYSVVTNSSTGVKRGAVEAVSMTIPNVRRTQSRGRNEELSVKVVRTPSTV